MYAGEDVSGGSQISDYNRKPDVPPASDGSRKDARISRSRRKLKDAFTALMEIEDPARITVKQLCCQAGVNRSTFYDRYGYMDALIDDVICDEINAVCSGGREGRQLSGALRPDGEFRFCEEDVTGFIRNIRSSHIISLFLRSDSPHHYLQQMVHHLADITLAAGTGSITSAAAYFQIVGAFGLIIRWIYSESSVPEEEIVRVILAHANLMMSLPERECHPAFSKSETTSLRY